MPTQTELFPKKKQLIDTQYDRLVAFLHNRDWMSAKQIQQALGFKHRTIRQLAEHSEGEIIADQKGYKLIYEATPEEARHAIYALESLAKKIATRAIKTRNLYHKLI